MTLYDRIRELRIARNMSQDDLARATGYKDRSMITKIEAGKVDISQKKIVSFARSLHTTPAYLMGWTDEITPRMDLQLFADPDYSLSAPEQQLVADYRALSPRGQQLLSDRAAELKLLYGKKSESPADVPVQARP